MMARFVSLFFVWADFMIFICRMLRSIDAKLLSLIRRGGVIGCIPFSRNFFFKKERCYVFDVFLFFKKKKNVFVLLVGFLIYG